MKQIFATWALAGLLAFGTQAQAQQSRVKGSKKYTTKEVQVSDYTAIRVMGSPDVIYTQTAGRPGVEIYGSDNIVDLIEVTAKEGTLMVKYKNKVSISDPGKLEIRVRSAHLSAVAIQGSGDVVLANGIKGEKEVNLSIQGSGDLKGAGITCDKLVVKIQGSGDTELKNIDAALTEASIAGSGDMDLHGRSQEARLSIAGSGDMNASKLKADKVNASVAGSGDMSCYATQALKANVQGSGVIQYKGNPSVTEFSKKGVRRL